MESKTLAEFEFKGFLFGHKGPVSCIAPGNASGQDTGDSILISSSYDKTLIIWDLNKREQPEHYGEAARCLTGHNHYVTDIDISNNNCFILSSSWDKTIRLWDIRTGKCMTKFTGHEKEIESVCFNNANVRIYSGGHERRVNLWNVKGELKGSGQDITTTANESPNYHTDWITKVRCSVSAKNEYYATIGRDGRLKIWTGTFERKCSIKAHENYINALALSMNGQYIATGGKDCNVKIWDYKDFSQPKIEFKTESEVNGLAFNNQYQWIAAVTDKTIKVWEIHNATCETVFNKEPEPVPSSAENKKKQEVRCTSVAWGANSKTLYVGCSDGNIRVYTVDLTGR